MGSLIDDLLSFSQIGRSGMTCSRVSLDGLVRDTLRDFKDDLEGRNVVWEITPLPVAECDPALLRMVFVNLISNAIKFACPQPQDQNRDRRHS